MHSLTCKATYAVFDWYLKFIDRAITKGDFWYDIISNGFELLIKGLAGWNIDWEPVDKTSLESTKNLRLEIVTTPLDISNLAFKSKVKKENLKRITIKMQEIKIII